MTTIYLDHNSTTPIDSRVADVIHQCHAHGYANPASQHRPGQQARQILEQFRSSIMDRLGGQTTGMQTDSLIFTSGGTESNNLALFGLAQWARQRRLEKFPEENSSEPSGRVLVSAIEHPSVLNSIQPLQRLGFSVTQIPVDGRGVCDLSSLESLLEQPADLVSLMLANHETGVIQPVAEAAALCRKRQVLIHTDAIQAIGKFPVHFHQLGVDALSFTAHKLYGPRGIGGLLLRHGLNPHPMLYGGFQQMGIRPGTESVALAAGLDKALELFLTPGRALETVKHLRDRLESRLLADIPESTLVGADAPRVPNTLNIAFPGIDRQSFLMAADMENLAISTGSACASGSSEPSSVLMAMGLPNSIIESAIRISLGITTTADLIEPAACRILNIVNRLRR